MERGFFPGRRGIKSQEEAIKKEGIAKGK